MCIVLKVLLIFCTTLKCDLKFFFFIDDMFSEIKASVDALDVSCNHI